MDPNYPVPLYTNPADYFKSDRNLPESPIMKPGLYALCATIGFTITASFNWLSRRPVMSGVQLHIASIAGGLLLGHYVYRNRSERYAIRDAAIRHYIELHPEDFPPIERKQYRDIFQPWIPIR